MMRALVIYESMFGNTRDVALAIGEGVATQMPVETMEVGTAPRSLPDDVGLIVIGGPTHGHGMTTPKSRADAAGRGADRLVSRGEGVREWLASVRPSRAVAVATFDTRIKGPSILWGSAARAAAKVLRGVGVRTVAEPQSFLVDGPTGPVFDRLMPGEIDRARDWGATVAGAASQR